MGTTSRRTQRERRYRRMRRFSPPSRVRLMTAVAMALAGALFGVATTAYAAFVTSRPVIVGPEDYNPRGDVGSPQLMAGGCVIRFTGPGHRPVRHFNRGHICANVTRVSINSSGQLTATFARTAAVITLNVDEDETLTARGIMAGGSGGSNAATITFYDSRARRVLNLNRQADRDRIGGTGSNIWLSFLQVGPPPST